MLVKTPAEMAAADLPAHAARKIEAAPITDVYLIGRRGPAESKFTTAELREMGTLSDCAPVIDAAQIPEAAPASLEEKERRRCEKNLTAFRGFSALSMNGARKRLHFVFHARPVEILGVERVAGLRLERTRIEDGAVIGTGTFFEIPCGVVLAAIGYHTGMIDGIPIDQRNGTVGNRNGRAGRGLYVVGWARRGAQGVIGSNKADGDLIAGHIDDDFPMGRKPGRAAFEKWLGGQGVRWVSFAGWKEIDAAEIAAAPDGAPRSKLVRVEDMLAAAENTAK